MVSSWWRLNDAMRRPDMCGKTEQVLPAAFPGRVLFSLPTCHQILNFGLTAQIKCPHRRFDRVKNLSIAGTCAAASPFRASSDALFSRDRCTSFCAIDRARALQFGITPSDIANNRGNEASAPPNR